MRAKARIVATLLAAAALWMSAVQAWAVVRPNDPGSIELVEAWERYDGQSLTFSGEAVGDVMVRGRDAWIHVNDDAYFERNIEEGAPLGGYNTGMAVWLPAAEARKVAVVGGYKAEGDVVTVRGVFNAACAIHGGDMDIHADRLDVAQPGRAVVDRVKPVKLAWTAGLGLLAAALWGLHRRDALRPYLR